MDTYRCYNADFQKPVKDFKNTLLLVQYLEGFFPQGGGGVQIPRRGLMENFNMAKINSLAIPGGGSGPPVPPPSGSAHADHDFSDML